MNIRLHIERLVLEGIDVPPGRRAFLKSACEARLTHLLAQGGIAPDLPRSAGANADPGSSVPMPDPMDTSLLGRKIAQAVYGRIKP